MPTKVIFPPPDNWYLATNFGIVYYNSCDTTIYHSVPYNTLSQLSFQYARTGVAYVLNDLQNGGTRGYLQSRLKDSLIVNKKYYVEFFVNIPNTMKNACNNVAALLSNTAVYVDTNATPYGVLPANPQVYNYGNPVLGDTLNWTKVSTVYKANGGEQYITLGNFKDDAHTIMQSIQPTGYFGAKYYIDDVSVIPLDSFCLKADAGRDTTVKVGDSVFIGSYANGIDTIKWYNSSGQLIDSIRPGFWYTPNTTGTTFFILQQTVNGCFSSDTVYINAVLPLKFISYSVISTKEKSAQNTWQTVNEINVSHYNIQHSTNGKGFTTIGTVKANNKTSNNYTFTDELKTKDQDPKTLYYRIQSIDNDGKKQYSTVQQITIKPQPPNNVSIYPNPANDILNIECKDGIKQIKIIDMFGREVFRQVKNDNSVQRQTINLKGFNKGFYVIELVLKYGNVINEKLVVE